MRQKLHKLLKKIEVLEGQVVVLEALVEVTIIWKA